MPITRRRTLLCGPKKATPPQTLLWKSTCLKVSRGAKGGWADGGLQYLACTLFDH
jgi:hypothetical protein